MFRFLFIISIFFTVINGWWFIALPLALIGLWTFVFFIEILFAGLLFDSLFGLSPVFGWLAYIGLIVAIIAFVTVSVLKRFIR